MKEAAKLQKELRKFARPERVQALQRFFKTAKGESGANDRFLGVYVPDIRATAKKHTHLLLSELNDLLYSAYHEDRLLSLLILVEKFRKGGAKEQEDIYQYYLAHRTQVNNWDLVDISARQIVGAHLQDKDRAFLYTLAKSDNLWDRRIAMVATHAFIQKNEFDDAMAIATMLLEDQDDLIQKAVGWMLRELGKRDQELEEKFLLSYYKFMPRTMLRYSIEHLSPEKKDFYMGRPSSIDPFAELTH